MMKEHGDYTQNGLTEKYTDTHAYGLNKSYFKEWFSASEDG